MLAQWYPIAQSFRIVFGIIPVLFLPGFFLTLIFFPRSRPLGEDNELISRNKYSLDWLERTFFSIFFSICIATLTFSIIRRRWILLTPELVTTVIVYANLLTAIGALVVYLWNRYKQRIKSSSLISKLINFKKDDFI